MPWPRVVVIIEEEHDMAFERCNCRASATDKMDAVMMTKRLCLILFFVWFMCPVYFRFIVVFRFRCVVLSVFLLLLQQVLQLDLMARFFEKRARTV